jgi:hypothetical protein
MSILRCRNAADGKAAIRCADQVHQAKKSAIHWDCANFHQRRRMEELFMGPRTAPKHLHSEEKRTMPQVVSCAPHLLQCSGKLSRFEGSMIGLD